MLSQIVAKELAYLCDAIKNINELLVKEGIANEDIMAVFGIYSAANSLAKPPRKKFSSIKNPRATSSQYKYSPTVQSTFVEDLRRLKEKCLKHLKRLEKTLELPYEKNTEWIREYLINEAPVIISLPSKGFLLHMVETRETKMLVVLGAAQITECELLPTILFPSIQHIWLLGDHKQLCPKVVSQVNSLSH